MDRGGGMQRSEHSSSVLRERAQDCRERAKTSSATIDGRFLKGFAEAYDQLADKAERTEILQIPKPRLADSSS
jgi:DICT domain-containing protein